MRRVVPDHYRIEQSVARQLRREPPVVSRDADAAHPPALAHRLQLVANLLRELLATRHAEKVIHIDVVGSHLAQPPLQRPTPHDPVIGAGSKNVLFPPPPNGLPEHTRHVSIKAK
jgi:hypothetical protein